MHTAEESQQRDDLKNNYCHKHNIPIIRIPYTELEQLKLQDLCLETTTFLVTKE